MIGFTAEYESGKISIYENEIDDAQWFKRDEIPRIPDNSALQENL
jgi:NAD+ diphosphatase